MSKKYTNEIKLKYIRKFLKGEITALQIMHETGWHRSGIYAAIDKYKKYGESAFTNASQYQFYSKELKLNAIKDYLDGKGSLADIALKYNISAGSILNRWVFEYNSNIELKDLKQKSEVFSIMARETTLNERIEIVRHCITNNKNYRLTAEKYNIPYRMLYYWVKKYMHDGEESLTDKKRGRKAKQIPEPENELERLRAENEGLKIVNKQLGFENEVLKKKRSFEKLLYSPKSDRKKNT